MWVASWGTLFRNPQIVTYNSQSNIKMPKYISVEIANHIGLVKLSNPPLNFINMDLLKELVASLKQLDKNPECRVVVLASEGKTFCAGADFSSILKEDLDMNEALTLFYNRAMELFDTQKPMIAAVEGAAIGAGFGLTLVADFRIASPKTTFAANFSKLGIHPGFGMSVTLPRIIGRNNAELLFYTGRRIKGETTMQMGLLTELVDPEEILPTAMKLAGEIATAAPLAVQTTRATMRRGLAEKVRVINKREQAIQSKQMMTKDFREGIRASKERRAPKFVGE